MSLVFQRLLLATEHTDFDVGAERLALALAQRCHVPLHGVLPIVSNPEFEALAPELAARTDRQVAGRVAELQGTAKALGVELAMHTRHGPEPYLEIVQEARERSSDMLIIRRRGRRSFLAQLLLGEMVSKVVAHAPCHVLVVPREAHMWQRRVLVAAEPGPQGEQVVRLACTVAAECSLPLTVLHVASDAAAPPGIAEFLHKAVAQARQAGIQAEALTRGGKPYESILQAVRDQGADLLVIGSRGDSRIARAWVGGVAQKTIGLAECPVLVAHFEENHE